MIALAHLNPLFLWQKRKSEKKSKDCLDRIRKRHDLLYQKSDNLPQKKINTVMRKYLDAIADVDPNKDISITEHLGCCLLLLDEARPMQKNRDWDYLIGSVCTLYKHYDPDLRAGDQAKAQELGEKILENI